MGKKGERGGIISKMIFLILLLIAIAVAGVIGLCWWLLARTIQSAPQTPQIMAFTATDTGNAFKKLQPLALQVMQSHPDQTSELLLTPGEFNAIFALPALLSLGTSQWPRGLTLKMEDGHILCTYSRELPFSTPYGKYFNLQTNFEPKVRDGKIDFRVISFQIGDLSLPALLPQKYLEWQLENHPGSVAMLKQAIADMYIDGNGNFRLKFYPFQIRQIMANQGRKKITPAAEPALPATGETPSR